MSMSKGVSPYQVRKGGNEPFIRIQQPEAFSDFTSGSWEYYKGMCKQMVDFFNRVTYPTEPVKLRNGIIPRDLRRYVHVQIDQMRFMFRKGHGENFIYTYDLLTSIMEMPIWKK